jgi:hypothetical protein
MKESYLIFRNSCYRLKNKIKKHMHLDKKMIAILIGCTLVGGIIGGGISGAIGSFSSHKNGGREIGGRGGQRMMGFNNNGYNGNNRQPNQNPGANPLPQPNATTSAQ